MQMTERLVELRITLRETMREYLTERKQLYKIRPKRGAVVGNSAVSTTERDLARAFDKVESLLSIDDESLT